MTYTELQEALRILELGERASMMEIKARHRALVKLHHPDAGSTTEPEVIQQINAAYRILQEYLSEYHFSFAESEFYEQNPEERFRKQFTDFYYK